MRPRFRIQLIIGALALVVPFVPPSLTAQAAQTTRWVNDDSPISAPPGTSCDHPAYRKIQEAVNAAAPGDRVNVCPGTYTEQVVVPAGKNNLTLRSVNTWQAVIKAPATMVADKSIVRVTASTNVTILAFTITGP